jgi:hypothetical protein
MGCNGLCHTRVSMRAYGLFRHTVPGHCTACACCHASRMHRVCCCAPQPPCTDLLCPFCHPLCRPPGTTSGTSLPQHSWSVGVGAGPSFLAAAYVVDELEYGGAWHWSGTSDIFFKHGIHKVRGAPPSSPTPDTIIIHSRGGCSGVSTPHPGLSITGVGRGVPRSCQHPSWPRCGCAHASAGGAG